MNFTELFEQLGKTLANFTKKQKIILAVSLVSVVSFLVFMGMYKPTSLGGNGYVPIFDKVTPSDSALIVTQLEQDGIDYKLAEDNIILVPQSDVYKARINVAAQGISQKTGTGFELFDKSSFGSTAFEQRIKYLRAIEGEIERSISSLTPIKDAKVHIAIAKDTLFVAQKKDSTASVVLKIASMGKLTSKQIQGIKNLVSSAVYNLKPENVKIVDQTGTPLGGDEEGFESDAIKAQIIYKKNFEDRLEAKIVNILSPIAGGPSKVIAKVNVEFDFSKRDEKSEFYDPNSVTRSEQTLEEKREGTNKQKVGGVPGAVSNIGPVQGLEGNDNKDKYEKNTNTINYEISKKITNIKGQFADLKRITAAVLIDGKYEEQDEKQIYIALTTQEIEQITNLTKQSIGYKRSREDEVIVTNLQFKKEIETTSSTQQAVTKIQLLLKPLTPILKFIIVLILLFVLYKKIIVPFSSKMLEELRDDDEEEQNRRIEEGLEENEEEDILEEYKRKKAEIEKQLDIHSIKGEEDLKYDVILDKLASYIEKHPTDTASLLESLIDKENQNMAVY